MTDENLISCSEHGDCSSAYVCVHLVENPAQRWCCDYPAEDNRWPDAWCEKCDAEFLKEGEWNENNEGSTEIKMLCCQCYEAGIASSVDAVSESRRAAWRALVCACHAETVEKQEQLKAQYAIGVHKRWDYDQETATLMFSNDGIPAVIAEVEFIGSFSSNSGTWLWAWANFDLLPNVRSRIDAVRDFGAEHGFPRLTVPKYPADEVDGWELSGIAARVLGAQGVYRVPGDNGFIYMAITGIRQV